MNRNAKVAVSVLLIGIVLMGIGEAWYSFASSQYQSASKDGITAYDSADSQDYINAMWDQYDAQNSMIVADALFSIGMIVALLSFAVLIIGMIPPQPTAPQQMYPLPMYPQPQYPANVPPPGYQYQNPPGYKGPPQQ